MDTDPALLPQASTVDHPADRTLPLYCHLCGRESDAQCGHRDCGSSKVEPSGTFDEFSPTQAWIAIARVLRYLESQKNSKFAIHCFYLAIGSGDAQGLSMSEFAARWSVTRAEVSKHCREIVQTFNLPPSRYMKSEEAAGRARLANRRPHSFNEIQN